MSNDYKKTNLTKTIIENVPHPDKGQIILRDAKLPGFGVLIGKSKKTYIVEKRVNGRNKSPIVIGLTVEGY